jgi:purine-nucleoside phosphorylase
MVFITITRKGQGTIDAPYREFFAELEQYQKEGVITVEMESAALFAVAQYKKVKLGCLFTVIDSLAGLKWEPKFHKDTTKSGLHILFQVALNALRELIT